MSSWADSFPYFAGAFKLIVMIIGGYFAIKWHFDEERRVREAQGEVFDKVGFAKKVAVIIFGLFILTLVVTVSVYATNWLLY